MSNATLVNFAAGETSPRTRGRFDLPWYNSSCEKLLNFIPEISGPARYRNGLKHRRYTKGGAVARIFKAHANDQWYVLEFTADFMRVYKDEDLLTLDRTTVTAITKANPAVITVASTTGLANGDEVIITGIVGMEELNGRQVKLAGSSGSTFQLVDPVTGNNINSTNYGTYSSGGTLVEVYQVASPFQSGELDDIQVAQGESGVMYLFHPRYAPRKLTIDGGEAFTIATYTRTSDPLAAPAAIDVANILRSGTTTGAITVPSGVTYIVFNAGSVINEDYEYTFASVVGTTEINGNTYRLEDLGNLLPTFPEPCAQLRTTSGANVNSAAWTAYSSGGTATPSADRPICGAFYEGRLFLLGTNARPNTLFASRGPSTTTGASRYDDYTGGSNADDAVFFTLAPVSGKLDYIAWGRASSRYLYIGTYGGPFRVSGTGLDEVIASDSINARQIDTFGCEAGAVDGGAQIYYIQRGGVAVRSLRFNAELDDLETTDLTLNAEHICNSPLCRLALQTGRPDILWATRDDGVLVGATVHGGERVTGWHRHEIAGTDAEVVDIVAVPRTDLNDQLWAVVSRTVNGTTARTVEIMADDVAFLDKEDFYTGPDDEDDNLESWRNSTYRRQEEYIHLDAAATYNGSDRGVAAGATLIPAATSGTSVTFTASAAVFRAGDVGLELWKKPHRDTGAGSGRAVITAYTSTTQVTCEIVVDFDSTTAIAAGGWFFAVESLDGLWHLEGEDVAVVTDGAVYADGLTDDYPTVTVSAGAITLADPAAVIHVGLPYEGIIKTQNLDLGGRTGPAVNKPRNLVGLFLKFHNSLGAEYGTDLYNLEKVQHLSFDNPLDRPTPVFSGTRKLVYRDSWEAENGKHLVIAQRLPLPCLVLGADMQFDSGDEE